jgi:hypothetical protein
VCKRSLDEDRDSFLACTFESGTFRCPRIIHSGCQAPDDSRCASLATFCSIRVCLPRAPQCRGLDHSCVNAVIGNPSVRPADGGMRALVESVGRSSFPAAHQLGLVPVDTLSLNMQGQH